MDNFDDNKVIVKWNLQKARPYGIDINSCNNDIFRLHAEIAHYF